MNRNFSFITVAGGIALLVLILIWNSITVTIEAGERGVLFRRFGGGTVMEQTYGEGFHFILPWNTMIVYNMKKQEHKAVMSVLSKNGLTINVELSSRYRPNSENLPKLHNTVGANYLETIIMPEIRSATREVIGQYLPEELYSTKREAIQEEIYAQTRLALERNNIILDAILIREVVLPQKLQAAIERKLEQEQASLEYEYKIEKSRQEAERMRIEAEGKAQAYNIVSQSLTDRILTEKGIEATLKLAESNNSKIVVIGGKDGLPIILDAK